MTDERGVSWGRWDAEHRALAARVGALEAFATALRNAEGIHTELEARLTELEHAGKDKAEHGRERRDRLWLLVLGVATGVVAPLVVTAVLTWLHLRSTH